MARDLPHDDPHDELKRRLARARGDVAAGVAQLRRRFDLPARFSGAVRRHPAAWFFAALATGWLTTRVVRGRRPASAPPTPRSRTRQLAAAGAAVAGSLAKPVLRRWLARAIARRL